ncbi:MAG: A24 family peptidase [Bacteroidota bacterium]
MVQTLLALVLVGTASITDLRTGRIPNALTLAGFTAGITLSAASGVLASSVLAAASGAGALLAVRGLGHVLYRQPGMGWGDVKLAGALGAIVGWPVLWALFLAAVVGSIVGLALRFRQRPLAGEPTRVVFAPFIAVGWALTLWIPVPV